MISTFPLLFFAQGSFGDPTTIEILAHHCTSAMLDVSELRRLLDLELAHEGLRAVDRRGTNRVLIAREGCARGLTELVVEIDRAGFESERIALDVRDLQRPLIARAVALAILERWRTMSARRLADLRAAATKTSTATTAPVRSPPTSSAEALRVAASSTAATEPLRVATASSPATSSTARSWSAEASLLIEGSRGTSAPGFGGRTGVSLRLAARFDAALELSASVFSASAPEGRVQLTALSAGGAILYRFEFEAIELATGPELRAGVALARGESADPIRVAAHSGTRPLLMAGLRLRANLPLTANLQARAEGDAWAVLRGVEGRIGTVPVLSLRTFAWSGSLGLAWLF